ncbi:hypothetical protein BGW80DRAFT_219069 [Lactifluus volemus]|nr:hypothetical protein BGW80DRAFT_219069 [Lactifluus volemus]
MKRPTTSTRAPSPTNTTFLGISNYRTESYKPLTDTSSTSSPPLEPHLTARIIYEELSAYLASYLANEQPNFSTDRQKLTRLTREQFQEVSTDVYDELTRRKAETNQLPFLPVREEFHPKRNQARQKLASLPTNRFQDLSGDVYHELVRRYPEFKQEPPDISITSPDDFPSPDFPTAPRESDREPPVPRTSEERDASNGSARPRRSQDDYNPPAIGRWGDDPFRETGQNEPLSDRDPYPSSRYKSSQDTTAPPRSQQQDQKEIVQKLFHFFTFFGANKKGKKEKTS